MKTEKELTRRSKTVSNFWPLVAKAYAPNSVIHELEKIEELECEIKAKQYEVARRLNLLWQNDLLVAMDRKSI